MRCGGVEGENEKASAAEGSGSGDRGMSEERLLNGRDKKILVAIFQLAPLRPRRICPCVGWTENVATSYTKPSRW
jgi:hypothetical protein